MNPPSNLQLNSPINILQWNCHSISNKIDLLRRSALDLDLHIIALSETWLKPSQHLSINDFHILRKDNDIRNSGGLLLAVNKHIPFKQVPDSFSIQGKLDSIGIIISLAQKLILILSIYRYPQNSFSTENWNDLFRYCSSFAHSGILLGDFNARHSSWGCERNNRPFRHLPFKLSLRSFLQMH